MTIRLRSILLLAATAVVATSTALAQDAILPYREYAKRTNAAQKVAPLTDAAFGANVSLYNGSTNFRVVDITLGGNSAVPVQLARTVAIDDRTSVYRPTTGGFADWQLDVPHIDGTFAFDVGWKVGNAPGNIARCSNAQVPYFGGQWEAEDIWHGYNLHIPDVTSDQMLVNNTPGVPQPTDGATYPWVTKSGFRVKCVPLLAPGTGEGFLAIGPDGSKYWFNWMVSKETAGSSQPFLANNNNKIRRARIFLFATRVEDRHGNWVTYSYTGDKLTQISSHDGRSITLAWSGDRVTSAAAAGKTWLYQYKTGSVSPYASGAGLERVVLPDGSDWRYTATGSLFQTETWQPPYEGPTGTCDNFQIPEQVFGYTVKHPAGASTAYSFQGKRHYRSRVPFICQTYPQMALEELVVPNYFDTIALISKTLSGPGLTPKTWTYAYGEPNSSSFIYPPAEPGGSWYYPTPRDACGVPCAPEDDAKYVTETESTGRVKRYTFGTGHDKNEGRLLAEEVLTAGTVVRRTASIFITDAEVGSQFSSTIGTNLQLWQPLSTLVRPVRHTVITQQGMTFGSHVNIFDDFARPTSVRQVTTDAGTGVTLPERTELIAYHDYKPTWTVGLPKSKQYFGQPQKTFDVTYYSTSALPTELRLFGRLAESYTYHPNGTDSTNGLLATVKDGRDFITSLSRWYRGVPRTVTFPDATSVSAAVNSYGSITAVSDELGFSTSYLHDPMGRVRQITYPAGDTVAWAPTIVSFLPATSSSLLPGYWLQTISRGNYRKETYFDGLWRPVLEREYDNAAATATQRFKGWKYDSDGQVTFAGYPLAAATSVASFTNGVTTTYDDLGRPTRVRQSSELGNLDSVYAYLSGFETQVTNPLLKSTVTNFQTFAQPDTSAPILIEAPEGQTTTIARDIYGSPTVLNRQGVWSGANLSVSRNYVYDTHHRLCATVEPETGATVMEYDLASNVAWSAAGVAPPNLGSATACSEARTAANASGRRVNRTYDTRNRVTALAFPDGRGNQAWVYTPDGLPSQITTNNSAGGTQVVNTYTYNRRRMLETDSIHQVGWYTWTLGNTYDTHGNVATQSYRSGLVVGFAPNALGQATQAGTYATGAQYFPNGALKSFTYGNNLVHTMVQNTRQLPASSVDTGGALSQQLLYDKNGNVTSITDGLDSTRSKTMLYDGLDRLTRATAPVFGGTGVHQFAYDPLDNLRSWTLGGVKDQSNYVYDANNRLTQVKTAGGSVVHAFGYDPQGNVNNRNSVPHDFDYGNRLRSVNVYEGFIYDGHGRRVQSSHATGQFSLWQYAQNGQLLFSYKGPTPQTTHEYVYLAGSLVAIIDHDWPSNAVIATKYQHTDALGSPVAVSNEAGVVLPSERTNYDPYGGAIGKTVNGIGYTGHVMDGATGLTYMQQRYYDPGVGRFLSVDPVMADALTGSNFNRYWYANNNPYFYIDPDGREVRVSGSNEDIEALTNVIYEATGVTVENVDGKLQQVGDRDDSVGSAAAAGVLTDAMSAKETVSIVVVNEVPSTFIDSYETNKVDVADMQSLTAKSSQLGGGMLAHVLAERLYNAQTGLGFYDGAHSAGLQAELKVMGADSRRDFIDARSGGLVRFGYFGSGGETKGLFEFRMDEALTPREKP